MLVFIDDAGDPGFGAGAAPLRDPAHRPPGVHQAALHPLPGARAGIAGGYSQ